MRWFKHFSDNHRGRSMQFLFDEMGHTGLACWHILMEICAEKLDPKPDKTLEHSDCLFEFHQRIVRQNLRVSQAKLEVFLGVCQGFGLLSFEITGGLVKLSLPILLDLLEYDQKRAGTRRVRITAQNRSEKTRSEKSISDKDTELQNAQNVVVLAQRKPKASAPEGTQLVVARYCELWKELYGANAPILGKSAGIFKTLTKDLGSSRAIKFVEAYLGMRDSFFVTRRHDAATLMGNLGAIAQYMETGHMISKQEIRNLDSHNSFQNQLDRVDRGEI